MYLPYKNGVMKQCLCTLKYIIINIIHTLLTFIELYMIVHLERLLANPAKSYIS